MLNEQLDSAALGSTNVISAKGVCTIQLIDNATGEVVQETKDSNMVTNAIKNILNPPPLLFAAAPNNSSQQENFLFSMTSDITKLLGGVMLWSEELPEDPDCILPPNIEAQVGYAGNDSYNGLNSFRGSYNVIESGKVENGYKLVWDFPTSSANGTIKCVTLTSGRGGRCGWGGDDTQDIIYQFGEAITNPVTISGMDDYVRAGYLMGQFKEDIFTFAKIVSGTKLQLIDVNFPVYNYSVASDSIYSDKINRNYKDDPATVVDLPVDVGTYQQHISFNYEENKILICAAIKGTKNLNYIEIDPITKTVTTSKVLTITSMSTNFTGDYFTNSSYYIKIGNYLYVLLNRKDLHKLNMVDGSDIKITMPTMNPYYPLIFNVNGKLLIVSGAVSEIDKKAFLLTSNDEWIKVNAKFLNGYNMYVLKIYPSLVNKPYLLIKKYGDSSMKEIHPETIMSAIYNAYLATINNLATPITKTNEQSLKIIYTLTNVQSPAVAEVAPTENN